MFTELDVNVVRVEEIIMTADEINAKSKQAGIDVNQEVDVTFTVTEALFGNFAPMVLITSNVTPGRLSIILCKNMTFNTNGIDPIVVEANPNAEDVSATPVGMFIDWLNSDPIYSAAIAAALAASRSGRGLN